MIDAWQCPKCKARYEDSENPDHARETHHGKFNFECDCGVSFDVWVDWSPTFWVDQSSIKESAKIALDK